MNGAALLEELIACHGSVLMAADRHGISRSSVYKRLAAFGVPRPLVTAIRKQARTGGALPPEVERLRVSRAPTVDGDAVLGSDGVTITLADYAILREQALVGLGCAGLVDQLAQAGRIIDTLTGKIEALGRAA